MLEEKLKIIEFYFCLFKSFFSNYNINDNNLMHLLTVI